MDIEILLIGNELLIGKIHDLNGEWTIKQVLSIGLQVSQISIIPDAIPRIVESIHNSLLRKPLFLITSGGLGPTFDDMTLEGIAQALQPPQELCENSQAIEFIYESYARRFHKPISDVQEFLETRYPLYRKMAKLPKSATPLSNAEGAAPGVLIPKEFTNGVTSIVALPGVPVEFQAIFNDHVIPLMQPYTSTGAFHQAGFIFLNLGESRFTELIYEIKDDYPDIWIKTHPRLRIVAGHRRYEVELHLTSFSTAPNITDQMHELYEKLKIYVFQSGGQILEESNEFS